MTDKRSRDGVLVIDKPEGPTSHRIVQSVRRQLQLKVGHTGTLDPQASGVLPLVLGRATRLARFFQSHDKEYVAEVRLGKVTDTYDREGRVLEELPIPTLTREEVRRLLDCFEGTSEQLPPMYSAIKVRGKKLYELARQNEEQERPLRTVAIHDIDLLQCEADNWRLRVHCSSGTYIRSLAYDLGRAAGCGAYLGGLRRTRSGIFHLERSTSIDRLEEDWDKAFHPMEGLFPEMPRIELDLVRSNRVRHGGEIPAESGIGEGWCLLLHERRLIALGKAQHDRIQPAIVLEAL